MIKIADLRKKDKDALLEKLHSLVKKVLVIECKNQTGG